MNTILVQEEPRGPSQLIEIPVTKAGLQRINFPDIQQLRSTVDMTIITKVIRLVPASALSHAPNLGGVNAPDSELVKMAVTIYCEGWEKGQLIPVFVLNDVQSGSGSTPFRFASSRFANWKNVDWTKTYIQLGNGTSTVLPGGNPYNVIMEVEYMRLDKQGKEYIGAA
jgi:hypothetical protein